MGSVYAPGPAKVCSLAATGVGELTWEVGRVAPLFDTSTVTMRATSGKVLTDAESIRADLSALQTRLSALQGQWVGDGRVAFVAAEARYQAANTKLNQALTEIGTMISVNEARYTADDASAQSVISSSGAGFDAPGF